MMMMMMEMEMARRAAQQQQQRRGGDNETACDGQWYRVYFVVGNFIQGQQCTST
jgi:hypothetical protein